MGRASVVTTIDQPGLVDRCAEGDDSAFEEMFALYSRDVYRVARRMTGSHDDADDVMQETFVRAFQHIGGIDSDASIRKWLLTIAINNCIDRRRRRRVPVVALAEDPPSPSSGPESEVVVREFNEKLTEAIGRLSGRQRACFVLHEMEGLKVTEIAEHLKCSPGAVKSYLHRARETLRKDLTPYLAAS